MVDDQDIAKATQPIRVNHMPTGHRLDRLPFRRFDEHAFPAGRFITRRTKAPHNFTAHRQAQLALEHRKRSSRLRLVGQVLVATNRNFPRRLARFSLQLTRLLLLTHARFLSISSLPTS